MRPIVVAVAVGTAGCSTPAERQAETPEAGTTDPCGAEALGLGAARSLAAWKPPTGCAAEGPHGATFIRSGDDLATRLRCSDGTSSGVDFSKQSLVQIRGSMSPATVGWVAYDDGTRVTSVTKFRSACPDDPRPMPMEFTQWYVVSGETDRVLAEATCTVPTKCGR
ncbi:MAG: hypothetical protein AAF721_06240 [Myxococcota bacterium]